MGVDGSQDSLTGVWDGAYSYPHPDAVMPPSLFKATLFETVGVLGGAIHEVAEMGSRVGETICATLQGQRAGRQVSFIKSYEEMEPEAEYEGDVIYEGVLSEDGLEISGTWEIAGVWSGSFLMVRAGRKATSARQEAFAKA
jgi:hypothetical protein